VEPLVTTGPGIRVVSDLREIAAAAAEEFVAGALRGSPEKPFRVLLSGGTTPEPLYQLLASEPTRSRLDWNSVELYFGDERPVGPEHPDSNYGMVRRTLLLPLGLAAPRTYRIRGEAMDLSLSARRYEALLRNRFNAYPPADPSFDLILLGLGADGHTASLFPGVEIPDEPPRLCVDVRVEALDATRVTATFRLLNAGRRVFFLVAGRDKALAVQRTLAPEDRAAPTPASRVKPRAGELVWLLDREAASALPKAIAR
jgi:6-phosphogluconolactonase